MERRKRRWWTRGITWVPVVLITLAVISGLFQVAVWAAPGYRDRVAAEASKALGQPVEVRHLSLAWRWLWPLLELDGVRVLDATTQAPVLDIGRLRLGFSLAELLRGEWVPAEVSVANLALVVELDAEGKPHLHGLARQQNPPSLQEMLRQMGRFSRIRAENVALTVSDVRAPKADVAVVLKQGDLRLTEQGFEWRSDWQAPGVLADRVQWRAGVTGALDDPAHWQMRWTLDATTLQPGAALSARWPQLKALRLDSANLHAAGDWNNAMPGEMDFNFSARQIQRTAHPLAALKDLDIGVHVRPNLLEAGLGGVVEIAPLRATGARGAWPVGTARIAWQQQNGQQRLAATADHLRLDDLSPWLSAWVTDEHDLQAATIASLHGDLHAVELRLERAMPAEGTAAAAVTHYGFHARFEDFAIGATGQDGVNHLSGEISGDETGGRLSLMGKNSELRLTRVFEQGAPIEALNAQAQWQRAGQGWHLNLPSFSANVLGAELSGNAEVLDATSASRSLKLNAGFSVHDLTRLKPLMPLHWGQPLKDWLNRAIVRGHVSDGKIAINGPLADFPFHKNPTGEWALDFRIGNARLEYHPDWPGADQLNATLHFKGNGLHFEADHALINGVSVVQVQGAIEDFTETPLVLDGKTHAAAQPYYDFLRASPLATKLAGLINHTRLDGEADVAVHLEVPLHSNTGLKTVARGSVNLAGATLHHDALEAPVTALTGQLDFGGGKGVSADNLTGLFYDTPLRAHISTNAEGSDELSVETNVDFQAPQGVAARYVPQWLRQRLLGAAPWQLSLPLSGSHAGQVRLASSLKGVASHLPPPMSKPGTEAMPISLTIGSDDAAPLRVTAQVPDRLALNLRFSRDQNKVLRTSGVAVRVGADAPIAADDNGIRANVTLATLELPVWIDLIGAIRDEARGSNHIAVSNTVAPDMLPFLQADISAQRLLLAGYQLPAVTLKATPGDGASLLVQVHGDGNEGSVRINTGGDQLRAQFSALSLQAQPPAVHAATIEAAAPPLDPSRLPTLDLAVESLHIGGESFGQLTLASERINGGQRLTAANLEGGVATIKAQGDWRRMQNQTSASTHFELTSNDLAATLNGLGFAQTVSGSNALISGDLSWPNAGQGFEWVTARGKVALQVENGALKTFEPGGASRVLGLLNFYALPRRLLFDFRDVVSKGLSFDRIDGHFQLADGVAQTDDLTVKGPSLKMAVHGKVGLAAKDYDQTITVTPNTTGLSLGALLAGGTAVAAVGPFAPLVAVIANQVLDKPIGQATQLTYRLTGSWENPEIRKLDGTLLTPPPVTPPAPATPAPEAPP